MKYWIKKLCSTIRYYILFYAYIFCVIHGSKPEKETTKCNVTQNIISVLRAECYSTFIMYTAADSKIVVICEHQTVDNRITAGCVSSLCQFKFCLLISQACESTSYTVEYFGTSTHAGHFSENLEGWQLAYCECIYFFY